MCFRIEINISSEKINLAETNTPPKLKSNLGFRHVPGAGATQIQTSLFGILAVVLSRKTKMFQINIGKAGARALANRSRAARERLAS